MIGHITRTTSVIEVFLICIQIDLRLKILLLNNEVLSNIAVFDSNLTSTIMTVVVFFNYK